MSDDHEQPSFDLDIIVTKPLTPSESAFYLLPFDPEGLCSKCGKDAASTTYHPGMISTQACDVDFWAHRRRLGRYLEPSAYPEHLCRRCPRCKFSWPEATFDPAAGQQ